MSSTQEVGQIFITAETDHGPATALLRSPTVLILAIGFWGFNIYLYDKFNIDYRRVLCPDDSVENSNSISNGTAKRYKSQYKKNITNHQIVEQESSDDGEISAAKMFFLCFILLIMLHLISEIWLHILGGTALGALSMFYSLCIIALFSPQTRPEWLLVSVKVVSMRLIALLTPRCGLFVAEEKQLQPKVTPFVDVFFADAMCSLSKVFFDIGLFWVHLLYYPKPIPQCLTSIIVPSACASLPYCIRARQCIVSYNAELLKSNNNPNKDHLLNAIKYSTSLFPICISALQKTLSKESQFLEVLLIFMLIVNSVYSFLWDVYKDWGFQPTTTTATISQHNQLASKKDNDELSITEMFTSNIKYMCLRPRLRFGVGLSLFIVFLDLVLRFSWLMRFLSSSDSSEQSFLSVDAFVLVTQFLEIFRRAMWNLLRVEWEILKRNNKQVPHRDFTAEEPIQNSEEIAGLLNATRSSSNGSIELTTATSTVLVVNSK